MHILVEHIKKLALVGILILILTACGTIEVGLEEETPETPPQATVPPSLTPAPSATAEATTTTAPTVTVSSAEASVTETPIATDVASPLWAAYRDPDFGFGYIFPCHWLSHATVLTSYDEPFFMDRAIRGQWVDGDPPPGAVKMEIAAFDYADSGIEPGTPLEEAVPLAIDGSFVSMDRVTLGSKEALRVQLEGTVYPGDETNEIYFFQLSPEAMLLLSVIPRNALASPDVQAIVESLALTADEPIAFPSQDPEGPLDGRAIYFDQEAGYCFQYPASYTLETFPPSGFPYLGDIGTLKLDRPFYTTGLTSTAWRVSQPSTLEELVTEFLNGLPDDAASQVERNPVEWVGGVDFEIGREPAEFLEGVPGAGGSRDVFAKHDDRLYRLSFIPSIRINPQAGPDLETLFQVVTTSFSFLPPDD